MAGVAVIGLGYWGPNLVRNFSSLPGSDLRWLCDVSEEKLERFKTQYRSVQVTSSLQTVLDDPLVDAVAIATPIATHAAIARAALKAGKHVFVEKPLAHSTQEAEELVRLAEEHKKVLMVDHVFLYTSAVKKMKELIQSGDLGEVLYFDSVRVNLGLFQNDVNVVWDLAPHDLSIMDYILRERPVAVRAMGACHAHDTLENLAYIHFYFQNDLSAHFHLNWLAPVKIRKVLIGGTRKMLVYDDIEPAEKIRIYDKGVDSQANMDDNGKVQTLWSYRLGDMLSPALQNTEALQLACADFLKNIREGNRSFACDGTHGLRIVTYLEAIQQSLAKNGELVHFVR